MPLTAMSPRPGLLQISTSQISALQSADLSRFQLIDLTTTQACEAHSWRYQAGLLSVTFDERSIHRPGLLFSDEEHTFLAASRRIRCHGLTNFRDAGGYIGSHRDLPWGALFRSENLAKLTTEDWDTLTKLNIARIIDLRTAEEKDVSPTLVPRGSAIEIVNLPIYGRIKGFHDALSAIGGGSLTHVTPTDMAEMYEDLLENHIEDIRSALKTLESAEEGASLVHCTAGKDRTGIVVALYQIRAGVPAHLVIEDYLLSNLYRTPVRLAQLRDYLDKAGVPPLAIRPYLGAPLLALQSATAWMARNAPELLGENGLDPLGPI